MTAKKTKGKQNAKKRAKNPVKRKATPLPSPAVMKGPAPSNVQAAASVTVAPTISITQAQADITRERRGRGQPTAYLPEYCEQLLDFFDVDYTREIELSHTNTKGETWTEFKVVANHVPQIAEFAKKIGVCRDTIYEWAKQHPKFSDALTRAKEMGESMTVSNAMMGFYNPNFTQLVMKNRYGWKDKRDLEVPGGLTIKVDSSDAGL